MKAKSVISLLGILLACCLTISGCVSISNPIPDVATDPNGNVVTKSDPANGYQVNYYNVSNGTTALADPSAQPSQSAPVQTATQPTEQPSAQPATQPSSEPATQQPNGAVSLTTDQEKLDFFNKAVNAVKSEKAGFTKSKKTVGTDMKLSNPLVNAVAGALKDSLLPNDTVVTNVAKGESSNDILSPPGKDYASALTLADCESITCEQNGDNYIITVRIADATNPDAENSAYARIFEFITVDDIMNTYAPDMNATVARENVFFDFSGCYAKATIHANGTLVNYETYVNGTMRLTEGKVRGFTTDLNIVLSSTTTYTDFIR